MKEPQPADLARLRHLLDLADYRHHVARIYRDVHDRGVGRESWERWRAARTELLLSHPESPVVDRETFTAQSMRYYDYDPSWHVVATVEPLRETEAPAQVQGDSSLFIQVGSVVFERNDESHRLGLFWLEAYVGGFFLPLLDITNGTATYGAGRYLLDGAKSADLGSAGPNQLVLDFNFSYHPSCMWDPQWPCPLAPPTNRLTTAVEAGEQKPVV